MSVPLVVEVVCWVRAQLSLRFVRPVESVWDADGDVAVVSVVPVAGECESESIRAHCARNWRKVSRSAVVWVRVRSVSSTS